MTRENARAWLKQLQVHTMIPTLPSHSAGWYCRKNIFRNCTGALPVLSVNMLSAAQSITGGCCCLPNICKNGLIKRAGGQHSLFSSRLRVVVVGQRTGMCVVWRPSRST